MTKSGIVDGNGQPIEKRAKAVEIWVVKNSSGENSIELVGAQPNKAMLIEILCEGLKIAANIEFHKPRPVVDNPGMLRFFRK